MRDTEKCSNRVHRSLISAGALVPPGPRYKHIGTRLPPYVDVKLPTSKVFIGMFADIFMGIRFSPMCSLGSAYSTAIGFTQDSKPQYSITGL